MKRNIMKYVSIILIAFIIISQFSITNAVGNNDPMLKNIKIDGYSIEPDFDMFTTEYIVVVQENVSSINIEAIPDDENATVKIVGNTNLKMGRNEIEIQVTAEDGQTKQSYFLYITKGDSSQANANLKEIKVKNAELAPYFDKNTINYALEYPESLEKLEIEAVPEDSNAKVEIIGNENLVETTQNIEIKVTAKDGQTIKTYYLIAKKAGIPVEEPEGKEPESEEIQENEIENNNNITNELQDKDINDSKDFNIGWYFIIALVVIVIIVIIVKIILEKRRRKNEK